MRKEVAMPAGQMWLDVVEGEVVSQQKWSETQVRGSGGGGYINQGSGQIEGTRISSSSSEQLEFWVKSDDGKETAYRLSDVDMALRPGQRVRIASGAKAGDKQSTVLLAKNFASGETHGLVPDWLHWALKAGLLRRPLWYRLLTTWLTLALALLATLTWVHINKDPAAKQALESVLAPERGAPLPLLQLSLTVLGDALAGAGDVARDVQRAMAAGTESAQGKLLANLFALVIGVLSLWLISALALKAAGRLILGLTWNRRAARRVRERVLAAFE